MRVRSQWFKSGRPKSPEEIAGAVAFIAWRIAQNALKNTRLAHFDVAVGNQYFDFLREFLIFLIQVADRIAYRQFDWNVRVTFTSTLSHRVADTLAENQAELLGGPLADLKTRFIQRLNQCADDYAGFEYDSQSLNFAFVRYLGHAMQQIMDGHDQQWVIDQMMSIEAPEAITTLEKAMKGLLDDSPRSARSSSPGGPE
ncbi:MAG: hypothetical protein KGK17_02675 [Betaproteobacteria bacterium]|nr:hypothetical protein [Betaproteobacteria bacterium]